METLTPSQALRFFVSTANSQLVSEQAIAKRVVMALNAAQWTEELAACDVYVGLLDLELDLPSVTEVEVAVELGKQVLLFVREATASRRDPHLNDLLYQLQHQPKPQLFYFRDTLDFGGRLMNALAAQQIAVQPENWHVPPLPVREVDCRGREEALEKLASLLNGVQPVVVKGVSGGGRTVLALELAYRLRGRYTGGIFWLDAFGEHGQPVQYALRKLASAHPAGRAALHDGQALTAAAVRGWLASAAGKALVIVDDALPGAALRDLRAALPTGYSLLVTAPLEFEESGWSVYEVAALQGEVGLAVFGQYVDLPETLVDEAIRPLQSIVEMLGGHPLSLRLAAGWMQRAGGWQSALIYVKRLSESPNPLQHIPLDGASSHPNLEKAFGLLYNSLSARQKVILQTAGIFAPNCAFTPAALLHMAESAHAAAELDGLTSSMFNVDHAAGGLRLHEQLHTYALALLNAEGDLAATRTRYLNFYETQARGSRMDGDPTPDLGQLRYAFMQARANAPQRLANYTLSVGQYLFTLRYDEELRYWLDATLEVTAGSPPMTAAQREEQPSLLRALGDLCVKIGHTGAAQTYYERALLHYYELKSLSGQANTLKALGDLRAAEGHREEAQEFYDRTLLLYAQIDFQLGRANTLKSLGDLSLQSGDLRAARDYYQRTLELAEQIDFQLGQAHTLKALGDLNLQERDLVAAREAYRDALNLYSEINFHSQQAATLIQLGNLDKETLSLEAAQNDYEDALRLYRHANDVEGQAAALEALGGLHQERGDYRGAQSALEQARELYRKGGEEAKAAALNSQLASALMSMNERENALDMTLQALKSFHSLHDKAQTENTRRQLRELARQLGEDFPVVWANSTSNAPIPDWLKLAPATAIPQALVYAVRDFMLANSLDASQRILEEHQDIMLTDEADEVFSRMLRQYAGQSGPTRQIDKYRALLQRCRQLGIHAAFSEARSPIVTEKDSQAARLLQTLDAYDEALERLRDIPLVYASVQLNRANTLRELADMPRQDRFTCLDQALDAYNDALRYQSGSPLDYAQTQISRAITLRELADLPGADVVAYLRWTLEAYTDALQYQNGLPLEYARTQLHRANTLREIGELPGQDALICMTEALQAYDEALQFQREIPLEYAQTQSQRAFLLHEMAGLPGQDFTKRMNEALNAYDEALEHLRELDSLSYARTQTNRVALLRDMAGLPGEERTARLYQALAACNEALRYLTDAPRDYAKLQINRAHLMREIAGLTGEHRLARMREALAIYNEVLTYLSEAPLEYAAVQNSRAALLRELAGLGGENRAKRLHEALEAASEAVLILEKLSTDQLQLRNAQRMTISTRKEVIATEGVETFNAWWQQIARTPQPDWLLTGN